MGNPLIPLCPCKAFLTDGLLIRWNKNEDFSGNESGSGSGSGNENGNGDGNGKLSGIRMGILVGMRVE